MAAPEPPDPESLRLELRETITAFHSQITFMTQALGIMITANVLLLAYGFAQRRSGILLLASLTPIAMLVLFIEVMTVLVPISYVAVELERKLQLRDAPLIGTYAQSRQGILPALLESIEDPDALKARGFIPRIPVRFLLKDRKSLLLLISFVVQFCLFMISVTVYHYQFM
jgi:hypothetical protein